MNDQDWNIIYQLYKFQNMSKAAEQMYMTQSAFTKRVQAIEREFDVDIVKRNTKGVVFTEEGEFLADQAQLYLQFRGGVERRMNTFRREEDAIINAAVSVSFGLLYMPDLIKDFREIYPEVSFNIQSRRSDFLPELLKNGSMDFAIVRNHYENNLEQTLLFYDQAYIVSNHPIEPEHLEKECRIELESGPATRKLMQEWSAESGFPIKKPIVKIPGFDSAIEMVKAGIGYSILFLDPRQFSDKGLFFYPLTHKDNTPLVRETWLVYSKHVLGIPMTKAFIEFLEDSFIKKT